MPAVITLQDPSLYERLVKLLPRPDFPIDEVLRRLVEQPGRLSAEKLAEVERCVAEGGAPAVPTAVVSGWRAPGVCRNGAIRAGRASSANGLNS